MLHRILLVSWMALLAACAGGTVTDGYHTELPDPGVTAIVWGNDPMAVGIATTWLQKQQIVVLERSTIVLQYDPASVELTHTLNDEAAVLNLAPKVGARFVVFIDRGGENRAPAVTVRGVDAADRRVRWSGSARFSKFETRPPNDAIAELTCQALATAWSFRQPGTEWRNSSQAMCEVRRPRPSPPN